MAMTTFAAIDIGSYEISMKIFEFSKKIGFRELNESDTVWKSVRGLIPAAGWNRKQ